MTSLSIEQLIVRRSDEFTLGKISTRFDAGKLIGLIGPNGSGKSTLLRALVGLEPIANGTIHYDDNNLASLNHLQRAKLLGYLPQDASFAWNLSVEEAVKLSRWRSNQRFDDDDQRLLDSVLAETGLAGFTARSVRQLSGGEQMRVHIARLLYGNHDIIVADEPCASLDIYHQHKIMQLLRASSTNRVVLVVLHDLSLAQRFCDRLVLMQHGKIVLQDNPHALLGSPTAADIFGTTFAAYTHITDDSTTSAILLPDK